MTMMCGGPAERYRAAAKRVLALRALGVMQHLFQRGLAHIQIGAALEMAGVDLALCIRTHG